MNDSGSLYSVWRQTGPNNRDTFPSGKNGVNGQLIFSFSRTGIDDTPFTKGRFRFPTATAVIHS